MKKLLYILSIILLLSSANSLLAQKYSYISTSYTSYLQFIQPQPDPKVRFLKLYPNPAREYIYFEFTNGFNRGLTFQIISQIGNKMYEVQNVTSRFNINLQSFNRGIFFYSLRDRFGKVLETGKFQVIK